MKREICRDNARIMWQVIVACIFSNIFSIVVPGIVAILIGDMTDYLLELDIKNISSVMPSFLIAVFLSIFIIPLFEYMKYHAMARKGYEYDGQMMEKYINQPISEIEKNEFGTIIERISGDFGDFCWNTVIRLSMPVVIIIYIIWFMLTFWKSISNNAFFLLMILVPGLSVIKGYIYGEKERKNREKRSEYVDNRRNEERKLFESRKYLKILLLKQKELTVFDSLYQNYMKRDGKNKIRLEVQNNTLDYIINDVLTIAIFIFGGILICNGKMTVGVLMSGYLIMPSVGVFYKYIVQYIEEKKLLDYYVQRLSIFYGKERQNFENNKGEIERIELENVEYSYDGDKNILHDCNLVFNKEERYLIQGKNGCGKSTLFYMISGILIPQKGKIAMISRNNVQNEARSEFISLQEQNGYIFSGTLRENLFIDDALLARAEALKQQFALDKDMDHLIEADGVNISPGEKKKILLIRALLRKTDFYMFDEPLNHLDKIGTIAFIEEVKKRRDGVIVISHMNELFKEWNKVTIGLPDQGCK